MQIKKILLYYIFIILYKDIIVLFTITQLCLTF